MTGPDDPYGRRALFGPVGSGPAGGDAAGDAAGEGGSVADGAAGRRAFFTAAAHAGAPGAGAAAAPPMGGRSPVGLACRRCGVTSPLTLATVPALAVSLWWPARPASRFMRCPACHHWAWCRVTITTGTR